MTKTVVAIFNSKEEAENAADELVNNGFAKADIDLAYGPDYDEDSDEDESSISRFFKKLFGSDDEEHERYSAVAGRRYTLALHTDSDERARRVSRILDSNGAIDVNDSYKRDYENRSSVTEDDLDDTLGNEESDDFEGRKTIPIIEEDINIGKKEVTTGGVRIRSRIVEIPVEETIRLRTEHVDVERRPVDRAATEDELRNFKTGTVVVEERSEVPEVKKDARVKEEIGINKEVDHRDETVRDTVRKTEVDAEDMEIDEENRTRRNR